MLRAINFIKMPRLTEGLKKILVVILSRGYVNTNVYMSSVLSQRENMIYYAIIIVMMTIMIFFFNFKIKKKD